MARVTPAQSYEIRLPLARMVLAPTSFAAVRTMDERRDEASADLQQDVPAAGGDVTERSREELAQPTNVATATMKPMKSIRGISRYPVS